MGPVFCFVRIFSCLCDNLPTSQDFDPPGEYAPSLLGGYWHVDVPIVELVVVGHVDVASVGPELLYFSVSCLEGHCQMIDVVSGFGELLGGNGSLPFNGEGEAEGHCVSDLAKFLLAKVDESLSRARGERGVQLIR